MNDQDLTIAFAALAKHAPEQWEALLKTFEGYAEKQVTTLLNASPDTLQSTQGRTWMTCHLLKLMTGWRADLAKMGRK